jgi:malonyl-CoA O-methyltransferase
MDVNQIARHFSRRANAYDHLAVMQKDIADRLVKMIPAKDYLTILEIGCGTGYLCRQLKKRFPSAEVTGIDIAPGMLRLATEADPGGNYLCRDFTKMDLSDKRYDLIVSASTLHWAENIGQVIEKCKSSCGVLAYALFVSPSLEAMRQAFVRAYEITRLPYREHVIKFPDIEQIKTITQSAEYRKDYSSWRDAFKAIKAIGGNYTFDNKRPYINRNVLAALDNLPGAGLEWKIIWSISGDP